MGKSALESLIAGSLPDLTPAPGAVAPGVVGGVAPAGGTAPEGGAPEGGAPEGGVGGTLPAGQDPTIACRYYVHEHPSLHLTSSILRDESRRLGLNPSL